MLICTCWGQTRIIHYFCLSKELHIANPPFTNHRNSAFLNLVMLSQLTSHVNWPRTVSKRKASCQRDNDKDAKKVCQCFQSVRKGINQILRKEWCKYGIMILFHFNTKIIKCDMQVHPRMNLVKTVENIFFFIKYEFWPYKT